MERLHGIICILLRTSLGARRAGRRRSLWTLRCVTQRLLGFAQNTSRRSWLIMSYPFADPVATFQHNITKAIPFSSVLIRERCRPESSLTTAELYFVLAMAAKYRTLPDTRSINLRLLIVYSHWVQVLNVTTTVPYITSIVDGEAAVTDKMIVHQTSWFNFLDSSGQLRTLLSIFEGIKLEQKLEPKKAMRIQMPLQEIKTNAPKQRSKRNLANEEDLENRRSKSQRVSYKQGSRGSQDVS